jgi:hypothetical protein
MSTDFPELIESERRRLAQLQRNWAVFFRRKPDQQAGIAYFFAILAELKAFIHSGDRDGVARRVDSCGVVWLSNALAVSTLRLPLLIGRKRSWINKCLAPLKYTFHGPDEELDIIRELAQVLGPSRYTGRLAAHWTCRHLPPQTTGDENAIMAQDAAISDTDEFTAFDDNDFP